MRTLSLTISLIVGILGLLWSFRIYGHYYEFSIADRAGLVLVFLISSILLDRIQANFSRIWTIVLVLTLSTIPFTLIPVMSYLVTVSDFGWLMIHVFCVVIALIFLLKDHLLGKGVVIVSFIAVWIYPYEFNVDQRKYYDQLETIKTTRKGTIHIAEWKNEHWLYYNDRLQYSTLDRHMYGEAYIQPVMHIIHDNSRILVIGGENGIVESELTKFNTIEKLSIVPLDLEFYQFLRQETDLVNFMNPEILEVLQNDPATHLLTDSSSYDLIIIDTVDPTNIDKAQYYSQEFLQMCVNRLDENGLVLMQSGNPYLSNTPFEIIGETLRSVDLNLLPYHCQIPTIGHWSWIIASNQLLPFEMKELLQNVELNIPTKWWNKDAMNMMLSFGRQEYFHPLKGRINRIDDPIILQAQNNADQ